MPRCIRTLRSSPCCRRREPSTRTTRPSAAADPRTAEPLAAFIQHRDTGHEPAAIRPFASSPPWWALGAAAEAGYEFVVADPVAGEQLAVTVEIDNLGKDQGEGVDTVRQSCSTKHSEHFLPG